MASTTDTDERIDLAEHRTVLISPAGQEWRVIDVDGEQVEVKLIGSRDNTLTLTRTEIAACAAWVPPED